MSPPLLEVNDLKKHFAGPRRAVRPQPTGLCAVDGVSFEVARGETLALVGESGCGKSTVGRAILRLFDITAGQVVSTASASTISRPEGCGRCAARVQVVFQDPSPASIRACACATSWPSRSAISASPDRPPRSRRRSRRCWTRCACRATRLSAFRTNSRAASASASASPARSRRPELIVCDEPVSALDVSVKAQIINLLQDLQKEFGLAFLFISHDLAIVEHMTHRVAVMYLGKIVELATKRADLRRAAASLHAGAAVRRAGAGARRCSATRIILQGRRAEPDQSAQGLPFPHALPLRFRRCRAEEPELRLGRSGQSAACHLNDLPDQN